MSSIKDLMHASDQTSASNESGGGSANTTPRSRVPTGATEPQPSEKDVVSEPKESAPVESAIEEVEKKAEEPASDAEVTTKSESTVPRLVEGSSVEESGLV
jgi:hypothetical protein